MKKYLEGESFGDNIFHVTQMVNDEFGKTYTEDKGKKVTIVPEHSNFYKMAWNFYVDDDLYCSVKYEGEFPVSWVEVPDQNTNEFEELYEIAFGIDLCEEQ